MAIPNKESKEYMAIVRVGNMYIPVGSNNHSSQLTPLEDLVYGVLGIALVLLFIYILIRVVDLIKIAYRKIVG